MATSFRLLSIFCFISYILFSCNDKKGDIIPIITVATTNPTDISYFSVTLNGKIENTGKQPIYEYGFVWSITPAPTTSQNKRHFRTLDSSITFHTSINDLQPGSNYFSRAYNITKAGITYGNEISLFTLKMPWTKLGDFSGDGRLRAVAFSIGNKGYVGTGHTGDFNLAKDFWEYDPILDKWTKKADFPGEPRCDAIGFSIGNKGYIGTGIINKFVSATNDFWEYDPNLDKWTKKADFPGKGTSGATAFSIGKKGYVKSGIDREYSQYFSDFWEYNPINDEWTRKADYPAATRGLLSVGFAIGDKGYIGLGQNAGESSRELWEYNPSYDQWITKSSFPGGSLEYTSGFNLNDKGYVVMGRGTEQNVWEYNPVIDQWNPSVDFIGVPTYGHISFVIGRKAYVGTGSGFKKDLWEFSPSY